MYTLRRWWDRNGLKMGLACLVLALAWGVRQTQGAAIYETYRLLARPFQSSPRRAEVIESARVLELQERLVELESQNQQLRELLGEGAGGAEADMMAPIIGRSADHWWQQITLGRGSQNGVEVGDIVTGAGGLVGRITNVTANTSRVLLISDPTSRVGVTVSRSRNMGYMRGQSANRAVVEFFDKVPDVRRGDVISTSSLSRLFPAGLPIGRVESINLNKSPAPEAVIELSAPISYLEWVIIQSNPKVGNEQDSPNELDLQSDPDAGVENP
jgi:rod shape-determining protein MreC